MRKTRPTSAKSRATVASAKAHHWTNRRRSAERYVAAEAAEALRESRLHIQIITPSGALADEQMVMEVVPEEGTGWTELFQKLGKT